MKEFMPLLLILALVMTLIPQNVFAVNSNSASNFEISVVDKNGNPVNNAKVSLYSYLDSSVVKNEIVNNSGICTFEYTPDINVNDLSMSSIEQGNA